MLPIICHERLEKPGGLWTSKLSGTFVEGDPTTTKFFIQGQVEIKELGGHLKAYFKGIQLVVRGTKQIGKKKKEKNGNNSDSDKEQADGNSSSDSDDEVKKNNDEDDGPPPEIGDIPKLHVFLITKKPKKRMVDAHKVGAQLKMVGVREGIFGTDKEARDYEANIVDIIDIFAYKGVAVLKLPDDSPRTEEPIIYGFVKLQSYRSIQIRTIEALRLNDLSDMLNKLTNLNEIGAASMALTSQSKKLIKPLKVYRRTAETVWKKYGKLPDETIDFNDVLKILDSLDQFILTVQAKHIFDQFDFKKTGQITLLDFENYLIAKDLLHEVSKEILMLDIYDTLKVQPVDEDIILERLEMNLRALENIGTDPTISGSNEASRVTSPNPGDRVKSPSGEGKERVNSPTANPSSSALPPANIVKGLSLANVIAEKRRQLAEKNKKKNKGKVILPPQGLDYSGFIEAIQLLGYQKKLAEEEDEETMIRNAFCAGGNIKEKDIEMKYLTLDEFRKAFIKICILEQEFSRRRMKLEGGLFADDRNRERLLRAIQEAEELYQHNLSKIVTFIETMKQEHRQKQDDRRRERNALKEKLLHEANRFIAQRAQEKRLLVKKEQEERSRKRVEDKVLKNKLLLRQQENQMLKRLEIAKANEEKEKLKLAEIRALGYDILDLSVKELRNIPKSYYDNKESQTRLTYIQLLDLSHNELEILPTEHFFYWCNELQKLKLSQNRLKVIPDELVSCTKLEILEIDSNRITILPTAFGQLQALQRLNLANNYLTDLPLSIGQCISLRYLNLHSNRLTTLPNTLGSCFQLEYLDCSCNLLRELPEDLSYLIHLIHCDFNHNTLSALPQEIGNCQQLQYFDVSINQITSIPESFGKLMNLEFINFENNALLVTFHCYQDLHKVQSLNFKKNSIRSLTADFGNLSSLMYLDLSINQLIMLPLEIGLLKQLQKLLLSRNQLTTLPLEIGSCIALQYLDLSYNAIQGLLPETMGIIYSLIELNISFNEINELPESIVGFQEMKILNAERCQLFRLPRTILTLGQLVELNLANNRFTLFPIELSDMKALKKLNLYNNAITLLPRHINDMCRLELDELNLGKNQLKALPVEFVDLLETIPIVNLNDNPWNYLPPKWGHRRGNLQTSDSILGYNLPDALDFLYAMRIIYNTCETIWAEYGVFFYTSKLTVADFIQEIKNRIPKSWHDGLIHYAEHIFFQCKETGIFVKWYLLTSEQEAEIAMKKQQLAIHREKNVEKSRELEELRKLHFQEIYENKVEIYERLIQKNADRIEENIKNERYYQILSQQQLHQIVTEEEQIASKRLNRRNKILEGRKRQELRRLQEILRYDQNEYQEEKQFLKKQQQELEEAELLEEELMISDDVSAVKPSAGNKGSNRKANK